ncbi:hypothetical protein ILYODFUR_038181 [Ilyodon furcidens]|uniref:Uncharacterized protein n=1 Tax=Ilyodon furcidens TaxID=33524 RepID=A0ABV0V1A7_9TELE
MKRFQGTGGNNNLSELLHPVDRRLGVPLNPFPQKRHLYLQSLSLKRKDSRRRKFHLHGHSRKSLKPGNLIQEGQKIHNQSKTPTGTPAQAKTHRGLLPRR